MPNPPTRTTLPSLEGRSVSGSAVASSWTVTFLHSPDRALASRRLELGGRLRLGRVACPEIDLAVEDPRLSRKHATLTRVEAIVGIQDLGSRNGTFVNGARVESGMLRPGDIVRIGDTLLEVDDVPTPTVNGDPALVGTAPAFLAAVALAEQVASSEAPVLVLGETGTGKDLLARHLHARSGRSGPFVAVNCAALPADLVESTLFGHRKGAFTGATSDAPGLFLEAQGGTLFLDEIGELAVGHQAKLLRALDSGELLPVGGTRHVRTDARVVAATNADLTARIAGGSFRADLYARLAGTVVRLPPLRARRCDILVLARRFLAQPPPASAHPERSRSEAAAESRGERRLSARAAERLLLHPWPRNVRELQSAMRRLGLLLGDRAEVRRADVEEALELPAPASEGQARPVAGVALPGMPTREELAARLAAARGNVSRLAEQYGKDAKQIYRWLKRYRLDPGEHR